MRPDGTWLSDGTPSRPSGGDRPIPLNLDANGVFALLLTMDDGTLSADRVQVYLSPTDARTWHREYRQVVREYDDD